MKRVQLELGGKSAQVLLDDVGEDYARSIGFGAVLIHCGQGCVLNTRLLLPEHLLPAYREGVMAAAQQIRIGDPRDPSTTLGPLVREQQRARVEGYVASGDEQGAERLVRCRDGYAFTAPVGKYKPNPFGLYDMLGNAWEWVADCRHDTYAGAPPLDGTAWDATLERCVSGFRVNRGASWAHFPWGIRAALRNVNPADSRFYTQGFRVARELDP